MRILTFIFILAATTLSFGQSNSPIAKVILSQGDATIVSSSGLRTTAQQDSNVAVGDSLQTSSNGMMHVRFVDSRILSIRCDSELKIQEYTVGQNEVIELHLIEGDVRTITGATLPTSFRLVTSSGVVRITGAGADFEVSIDDQQSAAFGVSQGSISIESTSGAIELGAGNDFDFAILNVDSPPSGVSTPPSGLQNRNSCADTTPATP